MEQAYRASQKVYDFLHAGDRADAGHEAHVFGARTGEPSGERLRIGLDVHRRVGEEHQLLLEDHHV